MLDIPADNAQEMRPITVKLFIFVQRNTTLSVTTAIRQIIF